MNFLKELETVVKNASNSNPEYIRNLIKELLQDYALNYIYSSEYKFLIFTGGTCLKKTYGLNRLSEDLDFDIESDYKLDLNQFAQDLAKYFNNLGFSEPNIRISGNENTIFLKFDISDFKSQLNIDISSNTIYLRCDFSVINYTGYEIEVNPINTPNFTFFVKSYSLKTLFANKIVAFLRRDFYKDGIQQLPFKGRDVYDLFWLTSLSVKQSYNLKPNVDVLKSRLKNEDLRNIKEELINKLNQVDVKYIYDDLLPLVSSNNFLESFLANFRSYLIAQLPNLLI